MSSDVPSESPNNVEPPSESANPRFDTPNETGMPDTPDTSIKKRRFPLLIAAVLVGLVYTQSHLINTFCRPAPEQHAKIGVQAPHYKVLAIENSWCVLPVCKVYKVEVPRMMSGDELIAIANTIIQEATSRESIDALSCLFYLPGTSTSPSYTAGKADWAPDGSSKPSHKLVVYVGTATPDPLQPSLTTYDTTP